MNKEEAAKFLELSPRALERYAKQGKLSVRYERGKTRPVALYDADELATLKAELERPLYRPATTQNATNSDTKSETATDTENGKNETPGTTTNRDENQLARFGEVVAISPDTMDAAAHLLSRLLVMAQSQGGQSPSTSARSEAPMPTLNLGDKLLLTLPECSALTGLSRAVLRAAIEADELKARQIGRAWRVKREELEKWVSGL